MSAETIRLVNRAAVVVRPKQSFIDWANHFNDGGPTLDLEDARRDPDVFLKAEDNLGTHGVTFDEAQEVFLASIRMP